MPSYDADPMGEIDDDPGAGADEDEDYSLRHGPKYRDSQDLAADLEARTARSPALRAIRAYRNEPDAFDASDRLAARLGSGVPTGPDFCGPNLDAMDDDDIRRFCARMLKGAKMDRCADHSVGLSNLHSYACASLEARELRRSGDVARASRLEAFMETAYRALPIKLRW